MVEFLLENNERIINNLPLIVYEPDDTFTKNGGSFLKWESTFKL